MLLHERSSSSWVLRVIFFCYMLLPLLSSSPNLGGFSLLPPAAEEARLGGLCLLLLPFYLVFLLGGRGFSTTRGVHGVGAVVVVVAARASSVYVRIAVVERGSYYTDYVALDISGPVGAAAAPRSEDASSPLVSAIRSSRREAPMQGLSRSFRTSFIHSAAPPGGRYLLLRGGGPAKRTPAGRCATRPSAVAAGVCRRFWGSTFRAIFLPPLGRAGWRTHTQR